MSDASRSSRTPSTLSASARWAIIAGIPLLVLAVYLFVSPVAVEKEGGGLFYCGSAMSPNSEGKNICEPIEKANRYRAVAALATGVAVPLAGVFLFGRPRRDDEWDDRDDELDDLDHDDDDLIGDSRSSRRAGAARSRRRADGFDEQPRSRRRDDDDDFDEFDEQPRSRRRDDDDWSRGDRR